MPSDLIKKKTNIFRLLGVVLIILGGFFISLFLFNTLMVMGAGGPNDNLGTSLLYLAGMVPLLIGILIIPIGLLCILFVINEQKRHLWDLIMVLTGAIYIDASIFIFILKLIGSDYWGMDYLGYGMVIITFLIGISLLIGGIIDILRRKNDK